MKTLKTKVIIVGSGAAGLSAAIHLFENGIKDILVIGDRKFEDAHTNQARGGINASLATLDHEDTPLIHAVDTFREGNFLANPHLVETLANEAIGGIDDLLRFGANFHKEDDGKTYTQRFFGAHSYRRTLFSGDETGKEMIRVLTKRARELEIPFLEYTYVDDLYVDKGKVYGVGAIDRTGELYEVYAPVVVFAVGGFSNVYYRSSSRNKENFGDLIHLAYKKGATIGDIELVQFHPTGLLFPEEKFGELVTEAVRGEGGKLYNSLGERFMEKYDPIKKELSTRDVVARAIFMEIHQGRGTEKGGVYLDISHREKSYILERLPKMHSMILEYNNIDISEKPVEIAPTGHYTMGGIWFDNHDYTTTIENFYAAGECTMGVHGANRLGGNSLMETIVFGKKIAQAILKKTDFSLKTDLPKQEKLELLSGSLDPETLLADIRKNVWEYAGIVRVESELLELQAYLKKTQVSLEAKGLKTSGDLFTDIMQQRRVESVLGIAEMICFGALARKESRGAHYRSDFPDMLSEFDKNLLHSIKNDEKIIEWKPVPTPSPELQKGLDTIMITQNYGHAE